jgi:molecular chaperone Hsp33
MAEASARDDLVMAFAVAGLGVRGRLIRLGAAVDDIIGRHDYPPSVSALLAEAVALAAMLGSSLKFDGKFILQTKTDGAVDMIVADYVSPGGIRGYARFDKGRLQALGPAPRQADLLGKGHLAMTVDQGPGMERYQGIVPLGGGDLTAAAHAYFAQSEQIPTRLRLAAGPVLMPGQAEAWRAGAIMVQHLPAAGAASPIALSAGDAPPGAATEAFVESDDWRRARLLLETVEDHEILDPLLSPERLLYRLYHEEGVAAFPAAPLKRHCSCARATIEGLLRSFSDADRTAMVEDGAITVTCEFCATGYRFDPAEVTAA